MLPMGSHVCLSRHFPKPHHTTPIISFSWPCHILCFLFWFLSHHSGISRSMTNWPRLRRPTTNEKAHFGRPKLASPQSGSFPCTNPFQDLFPWPKQARKSRFPTLNLPFYFSVRGREFEWASSGHFPLDSFTYLIYVQYFFSQKKTPRTERDKKLPVYLYIHTCTISNPVLVGRPNSAFVSCLTYLHTAMQGVL